MFHHRVLAGWGLVAAGLLALPVQALQVQKLSPQGVVNEVRQVVLRTDQDAVRFGDPQAAAPAAVTCSDEKSAQGTSRWNSAREWVWQFERPVPPGVRCQVQLNKTFQSPEKQTLKGAARYQFEVAGPDVTQVWPFSYESIEEEQVFVLRFNAVPTPQSVQAHAYCRSQEVGERIPVRWVEGAVAQEIVQGLHLDGQVAQEPGQWVLLACNRRLTAGSKVQLVIDAGVQTAAGVVSRKSRALEFSVRDAFTAEMVCERENANAGCLPIRSIDLNLSAPIDKALAAQVRLVGGGATLAPKLDAEDANAVRNLVFGPAGLLPETSYRLELPAPFTDDSGRPLVNAASFPLALKTGRAPALAKFASAEFGVLERFAQTQGGRTGDGVAVLPLTVRHIEGLDQPAAKAQLRDLVLTEDADIIAWWNKLARYRWGHVDRKQAAQDVQGPLPAPLPKQPRSSAAEGAEGDAGDEGVDYREVTQDSVATRVLSLLRGQPGVQQVLLPSPKEGDPRPFEVVGVPLKQPGFHVLEIDSPNLGAALLDERLGAERRMFVRTSALVTNLAVHAKLGKENSAVWVTSLDRGRPVAGAQVQISTCAGHLQAQGLTDGDGLLLLPDIVREAPQCNGEAESGNWFISARAEGDMAFIWSNWQRGIEPWRFNLPQGWSNDTEIVAHTVLDRSLVRAGETVSMKHFVRAQSMEGLRALPDVTATAVAITHVGSGQRYELPIEWVKEDGTARYAVNRFAVPPAAKLGAYRIELVDGDATGRFALHTGQFRVEEFRLPVLEGSVQPVPKAPLVQPGAMPVAVSLHYLNGGSAKGQQVQVNALLREQGVSFPRWSSYSFGAPSSAQRAAQDAPPERLLADKLPTTLDAQGQGQVQLPDVGTLQRPRELLLEANFADPNGEIQTLRSTHTLWPAAVLPGILADDWVSVERKLKLQTVAVDTAGRPQAGVAMKVEGVFSRTTSTRKRLVGGFYSYDNQTEQTPLGTLCSGKSDSGGLLLCEVNLTQPGEVELVVTATDSEGRTAQAATSVWVTGQGELWFGGEDHDRMDLLPEETHYSTGQTARFQVRMPFREATALVTVEREGVLHTEVVTLKGSKPVLQLPVQAGWGPNVYVSVLALRGRLYEVPWYSFFTWGFKAPRQWWDAYWHGNKEYIAPTAMVDLSKPSFRLGVAEIKVQDATTKLAVNISTDKPRYQVREPVQVNIQVLRADGQPAAHAQVAIAAVDKALLELMPNTTWNLADGLWRQRDWSVSTATAQSEIVGRRHYGLKAAAPGGGGGRSNTRELFDTLLLWQPVVPLDAQGRAQVQVPLNDALTSFEIVAIADEGDDRFGTGSTTIATTQDLQLISGLPPVVREGDQFMALFTVRNTTAQPMQVQLQPQATGLELAAQNVDIPAGEAKTLEWPVQLPIALAQADEGTVRWTVQATDRTSGASDALTVGQRLLPAVPLTVQQATLVQMEGRLDMPVQWPAQAVLGKGGLRLAFSERLADPQQGVPGLRTWWQRYPYSCLEQTTSRAVGLNDADLWGSIMGRLPTYLDDDGLAMYFPAAEGPRSRASQGSDTLTAHLLTLSHFMRQTDPRFTLPPAEQAQMQQALIAFVTGKLQRTFWSPQQDMTARKLSAIAALALDGKAAPALLDSLDIDPVRWPTHSVLDWLTVLEHVQVPGRAQRQQEAWQILRNRLAYQGTQVGFSTDAQDHWWWLMQGPDVNAARLLLATIGQAEWDAERPRLVTGLLARQKSGAWATTTANLWAGLALRQFSSTYERDPVSGDTTAMLNATTHTLDWQTLQPTGRAAPAAAAPVQAQPSRLLPTGSSALDAPLPANTLFLPWGERAMGQLSVQHRGTGKPWVAIQSIAAVARTTPLDAGYRLHKVVTPLQGADLQNLQRGDLVRVRLDIEASADMTWVAVNDPIPAGATILGSGLGRDSAIATAGQNAQATWWHQPTFVERGQDSYRAYWGYLGQGTVSVEYTLRLNNAGRFALPASRVEALYAPEVFGEMPNPPWTIATP